MFAGGRLELTVREAAVLPAAQPEAAVLVPGPVPAWPRVAVAGGGETGLSVVPVHPDGAHDHVSIDIAAGCIAVAAPALGRVLEIAVDIRELGHVLLWRHHLPPERPWLADVFAIEPSSFPGRGFADAVTAGAVRVVAPGEQVEFGVRMRWHDPSSA